MDSPATSQPVICEVCGTYFETRRGLSSHARLHLRQLGVTLSENSGAPIELLYQLVRERDGCLPYVQPESSKSGPTVSKKTSQPITKTPSLQDSTDTSYKTGVRVMATPPKTESQGSPVRLKESPLLPSSPSALHPAEGSSSSFSEHKSSGKPLWAPLETDAPITLDTTNEVHVCQLCGCWYETRKGLASHARAHLRQMGIPDSEAKGSPIELLYQLMEGETLKGPGAEQKETLTSDSPARSSLKRPSDRSSPSVFPVKWPKTSDDCTCALCGEAFENRKGLGSHARSHLRHIGMSDLVGKCSAIDAVEELVSSGMLQPLLPNKTKSAIVSSAASSPAPASPATPTRSPAPSQSWTPHSSASLPSTPVKSPRSSLPPASKAPKAKKGFRLAVDPLHRKPKLEPVEAEVTAQPSTSVVNNSSPLQKSPISSLSSKPPESGIQSPPTVLCDYCGQLFETRKALSCHARAHLRQLGLTWSIKTSPIDLLKEFMMQSDETKKEHLLGGSTAERKSTPHSAKRSSDGLPSGTVASRSCASPLDFSMKEKSVPVKDSSCELCGFYFENRKALASHARAHLRQLGIMEWRADGATSPIELLSDLIRKDPAKVAQITRRYRTGDLYIKKSHMAAGSPSLSVDSDSVPGSSPKSAMPPPPQQLEHEYRASSEDSGAAASSSRQSQGHTRTMTAHGLTSVRSPRGVHSPQHGGASRKENGDSNSQQTPRTGSIPALLPKPPLTPLVKLVGKIYSLKCRFCEEVFCGPLSVQEKWIAHLQKHILSLGYKGNASPPATPVTSAALVDPVAV